MKHPQRIRAGGALAAALALSAAMAVPASAETAAPPEDWPEFGYQGVITDKSEMIYNETNEYIFPSVFHAGEHLDDPLGEWYLYLAPHDAPAGVMLMYADSLEGPWTEYPSNPIIPNEWAPHYDVSHISSPDAIWNEQAGEMYLYFHGENSVTRWATTTDGVNFEYGGEAVTNSMASAITTESSYGRVFEHPDPDSSYEYGMFYMANETDNRRKIRLAESVDGETWTVAPDYVVVPGEEEGANVSAGNLWEWDGQLYVTYHASSGKSYARTIDPTLRDVGDEPILLHEASGIGDDVGRVASPEIITHDGETYLFYESGDRLGATIAWAKDGADVVVPPPFGGFPEDPADPLFEQCSAAGTDEFEGDALADGVWDRVVREDIAEHEVVDGTLVIPTYAGGVSAAPLLQQELPAGSWQVTTKVTLDPQQTFQQAGILLYASDGRYAKLDLARATPGRSVEFVYHRDGSSRTDQSLMDVFQNEIWLRLTSDGDTIRAGVSYDGASFERYGREIVVEDAGFTHVGPFAFRGGASTPPIDATFDWFRFSPDADAYAECTAPDVAALETRLEEAQGMDTDGYTAQSVEALTQAIAAAGSVLAAPEDQEQVDSALSALEAAIAGLAEVPDPDPTPTPEPTPDPDPTTGPEPTGPPSNPDSDTSIAVDEVTVMPGDRVQVTVTDAPGDEAEIGIASEYTPLATVALDGGAAQATVTIPLDIAPGTHHLQVRAADGALLAEVAIEVLEAEGSLSETGPSDVAVPLGAAAALLGVGAGLVALRRRLV